jgi:hypothetical protein
MILALIRPAIRHPTNRIGNPGLLQATVGKSRFDSRVAVADGQRRRAEP